MVNVGIFSHCNITSLKFLSPKVQTKKYSPFNQFSRIAAKPQGTPQQRETPSDPVLEIYFVNSSSEISPPLQYPIQGVEIDCEEGAAWAGTEILHLPLHPPPLSMHLANRWDITHQILLKICNPWLLLGAAERKKFHHEWRNNISDSVLQNTDANGTEREVTKKSKTDTSNFLKWDFIMSFSTDRIWVDTYLGFFVFKIKRVFILFQSCWLVFGDFIN
ncbi:hypothetical protein CDAR_426601 [Caerostris darwini]|uniref:Uncharacterized protein n=1 Tax=Caerostris darwini TaxID=1538125 RepID=A0AAV4N8Q3_9ARAC|nr:hypothetical protein CDAR_426601 [Caerostris darwini]